MKTAKVVETIQRARAHGVPLVAVATPDQGALAKALFQSCAAHPTHALLRWDAAHGLRGVNRAGEQALAATQHDGLPSSTFDLQDAARVAEHLPELSVVVFLCATRFVDDPAAATAIWCLRDPYKSNNRTAVLCGTSFALPSEIRNDVVLLDEDMPDDERIAETIGGIQCLVGGEKTEIQPEKLRDCVDAVRGLSAFCVEQIAALALTPEGINVDDVWDRKIAAINAVPGLTITRGGPRFDQIGGHAAILAWARRKWANPESAPRAIVRIDEGNDAFAGAGAQGIGDNTGVSQYFHSAILQWMEGDGSGRGNDGIILVGPPGTAKTYISTALGAEFGIPTISMDVGALKTSALGESERLMREAIRTVDGVACGRAFVVLTCNKMDSLSPQFRRRFLSGIWYTDLPTPEERPAIWAIQLRAHGLPEDSERPEDDEWTGAEIRNCCRNARDLRCSLREAAQFVVPVARADRRSLAALRDLAHDNFLSTSYSGTYQRDAKAEASRRVLFEEQRHAIVAVVPLPSTPAPETAAQTVRKSTKGES